MAQPTKTADASKKETEHALHREIRDLRQVYQRRSIDNHPFVLVHSLSKALNIQHPSLHGDLYSAVHKVHEKFSTEPPDISPELLTSRCRILYILLELERLELMPHFRRLEDDDLPIAEERLRQELRGNLGRGDGDFCKRFCEAQKAWCPLFFGLGKDWDKRVHQHHVIPFYNKRLLQPQMVSQGSSYERASLYEVHIPAEFVDPSKLENAHLLGEPEGRPGSKQPASQDRRYYRFALKEFPDSIKSSYDKEVKAFRALGNQSGMIRYYGCYENPVQGRETYNILLEYADCDLNKAIKDMAPPISFDEIKSFWESMHEVATTLTSIHHLDIEGRDYYFWHGDIKPENILRVGNHFKLADPGDSWIQRGVQGDAKPRPKAEVYGGTITYAAPEKAKWLKVDSSTTTNPGKILQNSDVWSLGCVFSILATYVVLGEQGVNLFDRIRQRAHAALNEAFVQDVFHDNTKVFKVVTDWHEYLRIAARLSDKFTAAVLDMVDDHMLIMPPEKRWDAKQVSDHFEELLSRFPTSTPTPQVPKTIEDALEDLDLQAQITQESDNGVNRLDSDMARRHYQKEKSKADTTTSKSEAVLLEVKIKPTAQRSVHRNDLLKKYNETMANENLKATAPLPISRQESNLTVSTQVTITPGFAAPTLPEPLTVFQVRDQLERLEKGRTLNVANQIWDRRKPVKGRIDNDPLLPHYKDRDIIFVVDNGSSMEKHWGEAVFVLEVLAWRALGYDSDGMELYFTNPSTKASIKSKSQTVQEFVSAMNYARPKPSGESWHGTDLRSRLTKIMSTLDEESGKGKRKTVLVLTDGAWEGTPFDDAVDQWMKTTLCDMAGQNPESLQSPTRDSQGSRIWQAQIEEDRPITFQFIAFGHNKIGWTRMKRLDDLLREKDLPDVIDMEPSNGDVHKMFLGSIVPGWDETKNSVNRNPAEYWPLKRAFTCSKWKQSNPDSEPVTFTEADG
ncbi:hypothetical protein OQA88_1250 [Cercophora sp. LCS_1]